MATVKINTVGSNVTNGTTGSVLFIGAAGVLSQDSAKLSWDDGNALLTIGGFYVFGGTGRVANDISYTSNVVLADVAGLSVNVAAGRTYSFEIHLMVKSGAKTGGMRAAIGGTATAVDFRYDGWSMDSGGTPVEGYVQVSSLGGAVSVDTNTSSDTSQVLIYGAGTIDQAGTLTVQFAQNTSNVTPTVLARGSYMIVTDLN